LSETTPWRRRRRRRREESRGQTVERGRGRDALFRVFKENEADALFMYVLSVCV
jgi:hypothetical protein